MNGNIEDYTPREIELIGLAKAEVLTAVADDIDKQDKKGRYLGVSNWIRINALDYYTSVAKYRATQK
jgi:hypothetical protein